MRANKTIRNYIENWIKEFSENENVRDVLSLYFDDWATKGDQVHSLDACYGFLDGVRNMEYSLSKSRECFYKQWDMICEFTTKMKSVKLAE